MDKLKERKNNRHIKMSGTHKRPKNRTNKCDFFIVFQKLQIIVLELLYVCAGTGGCYVRKKNNIGNAEQF